MLPYDETRRLLAAYGIPLVGGSLVRSVEEAGAAAEQYIGRDGGEAGHGACAVKLISALHTHKSDKGFVRLGLRNRPDVESACRTMLARLEPGESYEATTHPSLSTTSSIARSSPPRCTCWRS